MPPSTPSLQTLWSWDFFSGWSNEPMFHCLTLEAGEKTYHISMKNITKTIQSVGRCWQHFGMHGMFSSEFYGPWDSNECNTWRKPSRRNTLTHSLTRRDIHLHDEAYLHTTCHNLWNSVNGNVLLFHHTAQTLLLVIFISVDHWKSTALQESNSWCITRTYINHLNISVLVSSVKNVFLTSLKEFGYLKGMFEITCFNLSHYFLIWFCEAVITFLFR